VVYWKAVRKCNPNNFLRPETKPQFILELTSAGAISTDIDDNDAWSPISITPLKWIASWFSRHSSSKAGEKDGVCQDVLTVLVTFP
jgi:hypothetical protein